MAEDRLCSLVHNLRWLETDYVQCKVTGVVAGERLCRLRCKIAGDVGGDILCTM